MKSNFLHRHFFSAALFSMMVLLPVSAAASPRDELVGYWKFKRGVGGPCASQIRTLNYYFGKDGKYRSDATMIPSGEYKYSGTYTASDTTAEVFVDGKSVGPNAYRIEDGLLTIDQPANRCQVILEREDY